MKPSRTKKQFDVEALEPRLMLSGEGMPCVTTTLAEPAVTSTLIASAETIPAAIASLDSGDQSDDIFDGLSNSQEIVCDLSPAPPAGSDEDEDLATANCSESNQAEANVEVESSEAPVTVVTTLAGVAGAQTDISNPATQQLTETLNAANAPPVYNGNSVHLTPETPLDLGTDLVLGPGDSLTGSGTVVGGVVNNGLLSPGNSPGITNFTTFDQGVNGVTLIEIGGIAGAGVNPNGWDQVQVAGLATLNGTLQIALFNGFVPSLGNSFQVFTWGSFSGEFDNWLGTAGIPGHADWAFQPTYSAAGLTLTVVQTPVIGGPVGGALTSGLTTLSNAANFLDDVGEFAEGIPFIGSELGAISGLGTAIQNAINARLSSFPNPAQVASTIESWDGSNFGGFTFDVKGVLAHYGTLPSQPMWWDVTIELTPAAVNEGLDTVLGAVFGAVFTGSPSVNVSGSVVLDFAFGYDSGIGGFFAEIDSIAAVATINASNLNGFGFSFDTPAGIQGLNVQNGSVNLTAQVSATPDESILTGGRITQATLSGLNGSNIGNAFNLDDSGTLNAAFPLVGTLSFGPLFTLTGTYTVRVQSDDLMNDVPDVTVDVNSDLTVMQQTLHGAFTLKNTGTETIILASNVNFQLGAGATRVLSVDNGSGTFVLLGSDLAGVLTLDFDLGPAVPNVTLSATNLTLAVNTSAGAVPTIDGVAVNLPGGPYYRVSGNATIGLTSQEASLTGDFVFEPRDTDSNTANGYEEVAVGVANLSFSFTDGTNPLLNVTEGTGAFVFRSGGTGMVGSLSVNAALTIPDLSVTGVFGVAVNTTNAVYNQSINVNGTMVTVNVPVGPYLRVTATGITTDVDTTNDYADLEVLGILVRGNFTFERRQTVIGAERVVTVAASNVSLDLGTVANDLISVTNGSAAFIITDDGIAGTSTATIGLNVPGVTLGGTFTVRINTTNAMVSETVQVGGVDTTIGPLDPGPYLQVSGTGVTLGFLGVTLTGNFSFEQKTAASGRELITVIASNVSFNFGTSMVTLTNGSGAFFIVDGGIAGQGQITASVNAFGGGFSQVFQWSFNTTGEAIDEVVGNPTTLDLPSGPFNTIDSGPTPVGINITIGSYVQAITGRFILTFIDGTPDYATVGVSSLNATIGSGTVGIQVTNGSGAFVIYDAGVAGEVLCGGANLLGAALLTLNAQNLKLRFNSLNADVGNPTPIVIAIDDDPTHDISLQFIGTYYRQYVGVSGTAELTMLGGTVTLGGNFDFERASFNVTGTPAPEDIFKVSGSDLHFDLKAGSLTVVSFHNGSGTFVILSTGIAGIGALQFQSGIVGLSGTLALEVNTTGAAINVINLPTAPGPVSFNLATPNYLLVKVTNGYVHLGSVAIPLPNFQVLIVGTTVVVEPLGGGADYVSVSSTGAITTGLSFSDFAAPNPFEFVSMLRQAVIWLDTFRDADIFETEIPFTGGTTLGDVFDWSQVFLDEIFSKVVSVELQSRSLALQTDTVKSGNLVTAQFKIQLGSETPVEVTVNGAYSNADNNLDELVTAFNTAINGGALAGRVVARIHKLRDQLPSDPDYANRFFDDIFVIALTETEIAKGTELNLVDLDDDIAALGFGPDGDTDAYGDPDDTTSEQIGVLVDRYDTRNFFIELGNAILGSPGTYNAAQQIYTYDVNETVTYDTMDLFGVSELPFDWNLDLGPIASAELHGSLLFSAQVSMKFRLGFDLSAREVPRILSSSTVPVPANGHISEDAIFTIALNDEAPIALSLNHSVTTGNNSIQQLADDLNDVFDAYMYNGPLVSSPTPLGQLIVAQKAGSGLAISALQEIDSDGNGVPDAGKDFNGDGNTDNWLGLINRLITVSLKNNPFATEMGFGNEVVDLDDNELTTDDQLFVAASSSTMKGFFIDKHPDPLAKTLSASVAVTTKFTTPGNPNDQDGIYGSVRFGFVEITTNNGSFGTVTYDGTMANPLTVGLSLEDQTTGETRFYLSDLFGGTSSVNIGNILEGPTFTGSLLARLDQIAVGGLGFNFPLGANPQISAWIPDINDLDYNADPYNGSNTGIFLTYPSVGSLQDFTSLSFTKIIQALSAIADQLSELSAFSFLDEPLPFVNISVNDMLDYASKFAELIDGAAAGGSQSSLQDTITEIEHQIEVLFDLNPDILSLTLDDGGLSGLSAFTAGGVNALIHSTVTLNPAGNNNAVLISTKPANLGSAATFNGALVRYIADPSITNTTAAARWDAANKILTIRLNSGRTTANAIITAINGLGAASPWTASLATADPGNTGAGAVVTSALITNGGVNGSFHSVATLMPGGDNNNFTITTTNLADAASLNGTSIRMFGDSAVNGNTAQVGWDLATKTLTIKINPGVTTANTIINAINAAGIPWNAALAPPDNGALGNTGAGTITTTALKFSFVFQTAYAESLPFQLDLQDLVNNLAGNNPAVAAFLEAATTLVQISGSGDLTVSASATLTLDFGLDLSNPSTVKPFLYDTTGVELLAKVAATNVDIEASLGAVFGIFIKDGKITLDADGNPNTDAGDGDRGARFRLGLKDNNGDGRHYFTESFFNLDNIDLTLEGGVSAQLPIFAPTESSPLSGDADANNDGYPDNYLVIEIADLLGLFMSEAISTEADGLTKIVRFSGLNNDLNIVSDLYTDYDIIFLDSLTGNSANASFNVGTNTLTVNIDSAATTALTVRNQIQNATGGGGHFAGTTLASDDDGNPDAPHTNTGAGKLEKIFIVTPDFSEMFADLDFCMIITEHMGDILNGLDALLGSIEDGLNEIVYNTELPLIGNGLQGAANFISDFRNGLLQSLRDEVDAAGGNGAVAVENAIKKALWNTLGPDGVNLLVDYETGDPLDLEAGYSQLDVTLDCDTGLIVNMRLAASLALIDTTQNPIDFEIGVPGFGLEVDGNVVVSIGFDLKFGFGFNTEDGFYFNSSAPSDDPELVIEFRAEIPGLHAAGELLFLQLDVTDDAENPSLFRGFFEVDLMDPNSDGKLTFAELTSSGVQFDDILHANLGAEAHLNLDLAASFGGNTAFPRVLASFHLDWVFDLDHGAGTPEISFTDIYLDLGTFISDFLAPILEKIQEVTEPLQPIIDLVTARIPILSDLAGETITLLTLAEFFGLLEPSTVDFIEDVLKIITLINSLEGLGEGTILIPFGAFSLFADDDGSMTNISALENIASRTMDDIANAAANYDAPGASETFSQTSSGFVSDAGALNNFSIPIFDNPGELFNLFIGEPVRLVEWRMPTFKFKFTYTQKIPIYPPLYAQFGGSIGADINIGFGYDTYGIQKFISSEDKNFLDILDGFYVLDFDAAGNERAELTLTGEIFAGASINLLVVEIGVKGGVTVTFEFDLNDVNDDGKVRVSEIIANAQQDPRCIFDIHGEISLFLEAYLKVDLFFFSIEKTWRFAEITLLEFDITCPEPVLASNLGGDLYLNMGSRASDRLEIDTNDNAERFVVKHISGGAGNETVEVQWGNFKQQFTFTGNLIVDDAGQGDDYIDTRGVVSTVEIHGGEGHDTIFLGDGDSSTAYGDGGNDTITASTKESATNVAIMGGSGNDILIGGTVEITISGDEDKDTITGSPKADILLGGAGDDNITGDSGDDNIDAGAGNDIVDGNGGRDFILGGAGTDTLRGSRDDDLIDGGDGDDQIFGSAGNDLLIGGSGHDKLFGHGGIELLIGDEVGTVNNFAINYANLDGLLAVVSAIPSAGVTVKGLTGTGNDFLAGGGNVDALFGGDGHDFMYGGNFLSTGDTEVIEEDHNDFFDGGRGDDTIFGDDSMGREGIRNTGIAIRSAIWFDGNLNGIRDADESGFGGVEVKLYRQSDSELIATEETEVDGVFTFNGLDPNDYYITFSIPTGMSLVTQYVGGANDPEDSSTDNDAVLSGGVGETEQFNVTYGETEASVAAGFTGPAQVSITDQSVNEGSDGQTAVTFTVTLSHLQGFAVEIEYRTVNGTATASSGDYVSVPTTILTFAPGETSRTITLYVNGDTMYENHEQFELDIIRAQQMIPGSPLNLDVSDSQVLVTIINDDQIPTISIHDFQQAGVDDDDDPLTAPIYVENMTARFRVTLSNPSQFTITVQWRTDAALTFQGANEDAAATPSGFPGADFVMNSGMLTFLPGVTNKEFTVVVNQDTLDENVESFFADLFNPTFAEISDGRAYGLIADDDKPVSVYILPVIPIAGQPFHTQVVEGNAGLQSVGFRIWMSGPSGKKISVTWATSPGTAVETVFSGSTDLVDYETTPNDSTLDALATLVFEPGDPLFKLITVVVNSDTAVEGEPNPENPAQMIEQFFVNILSADNAEIAANPSLTQSNHNTVNIVDDDLIAGDAGPWSVYFGSTSFIVNEPDSGFDYAYITIKRTPGSSQPVAVFYTTNGSATAGTDYDAVFRHVVYFPGNETSTTVPIKIYADTTVEGTETVRLWLRNPTGGPVRASPDQAVLRIIDGDQPVFQFDSTSLAYTEGSGGGTTTRNVTVELHDATTNALVTPAAQQSTITVTYTIVDLTARQPTDYSYAPGFPVTGTLTFNPGENTKSVQVNIVKDNLPELSENFAVQLSNPFGATIAQYNEAAFVTIYDDDLTPITGYVFYDNNGNGFKDISEKGIEDVDVEITYLNGTTPVTSTVTTNSSGQYTKNVLLGQVSIVVDGTSVTSPYKNLTFIIPFIGTGDYETTTSNESQTVQFKGIVGISPFGDVGYDNTTTFALPTGGNDSGRGGTDDMIFGGPGNDIIDAGAGDDHVVGGHWMTATDEHAPINDGDDGAASYNAVVKVVTSGLHPIYDDGPIFEVDTSSPDAGINANGSISGQIWVDTDNDGRQDGTELLFTQLVFVNLYDCDGNPINTVVTSTGAYTFAGLYLKSGEDSEYVVEFVLPHDYTFSAHVAAIPAGVNQDVIIGGRTTMVTINTGAPAAADIDAGVRGSGNARLQVTGGFRFGEPSWGVAENVEDGILTITVKRTTSFQQRAVVVKMFDGTAVDGVNYEAQTVLLFFDIGETIKTIDITILDTESLGICVDPLTVILELRDVTGRPYDDAIIYIGGSSFGNIPDDDTITLGDNWDVGAADSAVIPAVTVIDPNPPYNNLSGIVYLGGPGNDIITGGDGPDFINGQLLNDTIYGDEGEDQIEAGFGDDTIYVYLDDDVINGDYGYDTVISSRDVSKIVLDGTILSATLEHFDSEGDSLSTFTLSNIENAHIFGGGMRNAIELIDWDGDAIISGDGNTDSLSVEINTDMILKNASIFEGFLYEMLYGFIKDSALSLANGATFHLGSLEKVTLTGGPSANTINASGYTRPVTLVGLAGNDTLIGGWANDVFMFDADNSLGTDSITGNGGLDTLNFSSTTIGVDVDLADPASQTVVVGNLNLILVDDIENATGGLGNDFLYGNGLSNVLQGGEGDDWLEGRGGDETYVFDTDFDWGDETVVEDILIAGHDKLDFSGTTGRKITLNMMILGAFQTVNVNLTLKLIGEGIEEVIGGSLADSIQGNGNNNTLRGGPGADLLDGNNGDDELDGGAGNDDLDGGDGNDTINEIENTNFTLTDTSLVRGTGENDTLNNIEVANLVGGVGNNVFTLTGWTGNGNLSGVGGNDTLVWAADANFSLTDVSLNVTPVVGMASNFTLSSIETARLTGGPNDNNLNAVAFTGNTTLTGGEGVDVLVGGAGIDILRGGLGNDKLTGNRSNDFIDGGTGTDTLIEDLTGAAWEVDFVVKNNFLVIVQNDPTPVPTDDTITESDFLVSIEAATITGSAQDDTFDVSNWTAGALTINGSGGNDSINVQVPVPALPAPAGGTVTLTNNAVTFTGGIGTINFSDIENATITGTDRDETIIAATFTGTALLYGMGGDDVLQGGPGPNLLDGGEGDDRFVFVSDGGGAGDFNVVVGGDGEDTFDFSGYNVGITIDLSNTGVLQDVVVGELRIGFANEDIENVIGGSAADTITGNSLDNRLTGGGGADNLNGVGGTDVLVETADADMTLTNVSLTIGATGDILANIEEAELTGGAGGNTIDASAFTGQTTLSGLGGNDRLIGGSSSDTLMGGAGDDLLRGNNGGDVYIFDVDQVLGNDTVDEASAPAGGTTDFLDFRETQNVGVSVDLSLTTQQTVHATNLRLTFTSSTGLEYIAGGDGDDTLIGNSQDNAFLGGLGEDIIRGGTGQNFLVESRADLVGHEDDNFTLASTTATTADLTIGTVIESETDELTDIQIVLLTAGSGNNTMDASLFRIAGGFVTMSGGDGNDTLIGSYGDDNLDGDDGNDTLYGNAGSDDLDGGDGEDILNGAGSFDLLLGTDGDDDLTGGNDSDIYVFDQSYDQGSDTITERLGGGAHDTLQGVGISGIDVDFFITTPQIISLNLTLTLNYPLPADLGQIEHSF